MYLYNLSMTSHGGVQCNTVYTDTFVTILYSTDGRQSISIISNMI